MIRANNAPALERRGCVAVQFARPWRGVGEARRWRPQMRRHLTSIFVVLAIALCTSCERQSQPSDSGKVQWIDPANLKPGPIRHEKLSDEQMQRIAALQKVFAEVDTSSLEKWTDDFQRDMNPDRELAIWEAMAAAYSKQNADRTFSVPQRKELYGVLLTGSSASEDEAIKHMKLKVLSEAEARSALRTLAEEWNKKRQQDDAANGSQPIRSETNRTSSAAGSRR